MGHNEWQARPSLNEARGGLIGTTTGITYAIGGYTSGFGAELGSVERLDPATGRWSLIRPLNVKRGNSAAATARDGDVYVLGGFVGDKTVDVVEILDHRTGHWRAGRPLPGARGGAAAAAIGDRIYVVGGFDADDNATTAVAFYDIRRDSWHDVKPMPTARGLLKAEVLDGHLYAIAGTVDVQVFQTTVERYDPASDTWGTVAPLHTGRGNPGVAAGGRRIFVVGGASPDGPLRTTEVYDPHADRWRTIDAQLAVGRASLSAAVVRDHLVAFGGFEVPAGSPVASARVEALSL
ncbi:Kelch repeat-containing protein [Actinoplanes sp. CA-030573]|uniref:Kelch repeat-containing protein n=1 Tax=Actinoplanes sp. CA-030573 TaxID=3239898 RepID=UPI003D8F8EDF